MSTPTPPPAFTPGLSFTDPAAASKLHPKIILLGPPFSGKTTIGAHFPKVEVVDLDNKINNALKTIRPDGWLRRPLHDANGVPVPEESAWTEIDKAVTNACLNPEAKTILVDSISVIDYFLRRYCATTPGSNVSAVTLGNRKFMAQAHWNIYEVLLRGLIAKLLAVPKIAIITAHTLTEKDELTGGVWQTIALPGQSQTKVPLNFTDCWLVKGQEEKGKWVTKVRTAPGGFPPVAALGTSLALPHEFNFDWPLVANALKLGGHL